MLKIVHAQHGQGKTAYLTGKLKSHLESSCDGLKPLFIVPEQFHFETERSLYYILGCENISRVEITSFTKLSAEILSKYGITKPYCDESVKLITAMKAISEIKKELTFYGGKSGQRGFPEEILSIIENFKREGITYNDIQKIEKDTAFENDFNNGSERFSDFGNTALLKNRLQDIALIYEKYSLLLEENYYDKLDDILRAAELSAGVDYFKGRQIFFDGFDGFTGSQLKLIYEILSKSGESIFSFSIDEFPSKNKSYRAINNIISTIIKMVGNKYELIPLRLGEPRTPKKAKLVSASDVYSQCDYIAAEISTLAYDKGYAFNDIAILTRNKETMPIMTAALEKYGIAVFADIPQPLLEKPIIRFALETLEAATFSGTKVLNYIQSGFVRVPPHLEETAALVKLIKLKNKRGIKKTRLEKDGLYPYLQGKRRSVRLSRRSINELQRVAYLYNIKGQNWKKLFPNTESFWGLEPLREEIIGKLQVFSESLNNTTGDKITEALSDFLINKLELGRTVLAIINRRNTKFQAGFQIDKALSDEYRRLWDLLITALESMHSALRDYPISLPLYIEIFKHVLLNMDIARPPQVLDAVTVGDIDRTRTAGIKIAFIIDALSGVFPKSSKPSGEFSADEIEAMEKMGLKLSEDRMGRYYRERFIIHKTLSLPSEMIFITAPRNDLSYSQTDPSPIFKEVAAKYNIPVIDAESLPRSFFAKTRRTLEQIAARNPYDKSLRETLKRYSMDFYQKLSTKYSATHTALSDDVKLLIGNRPESPTSVKTLITCPFSYFCRYGLSVFSDGVENTGDLTPLLSGNLIHYCIEKATSDFTKFMSLSDEELGGFTERLIKSYSDNLPYKKYTDGKTDYLLKANKNDIKRLLSDIKEEFLNSPFKILDTERPFTCSLNGIEISGRIDRVDVIENEKSKLIRVVDYKSGKERFDWDKVYYGLDLQILLYLFAFGENAEPSGAFIKNTSGGISKTVHCSKTLVPTPEENEKNWIDSRRMCGLQIKNEGDEKELARLAALYRQKVYKDAKGNKAEFITAKKLDKENYLKLKQYVGNLLTEKRESILSGSLPAIPLRREKGTDTPCTYCDYHEICKNEDEFINIESGLTDSIFLDKE